MPSGSLKIAVACRVDFVRCLAEQEPHRLLPAGPRGGGDYGDVPGQRGAVEPENLPFRVELWDEAKLSVEQVLAVTASGSIGYAAYYAATREYPNRFITLRHNNGIVSRWNGPSH